MRRWLRWVGLYVGGVVALVFVYALAYNLGMATVENDPQPFVRSLWLVVVHFATTGWNVAYPSSGLVNALILLVSVTGQTVLLGGFVAAIAAVVVGRSSTART